MIFMKVSFFPLSAPNPGGRARRRPPLLTVSLAALALTAGCSGPAEDQDADDLPRAVVSLYPVQFLAERIAGDDAVVTNLVPAGAEPHEVELGPRDVFEMDQAEIVIITSGFQPPVEAAAAETTGVVDLAEVVDLRERGGALDPHFWLDPARMQAAAVPIAEAFASANPAHGSQYQDRADNLEAALAELDEAFRTGLSECTYDTFVTGHAAFGDLADAYGLQEIALAGIHPESDPSQAAIAATQQQLRELGLPVVFAEPGAGKIAEVLAGELDLDVETLNPVESVTSGEDYLSIMTDNLTALKKGLQ